MKLQSYKGTKLLSYRVKMIQSTGLQYSTGLQSNRDRELQSYRVTELESYIVTEL